MSENVSMPINLTKGIKSMSKFDDFNWDFETEPKFSDLECGAKRCWFSVGQFFNYENQRAELTGINETKSCHGGYEYVFNILDTPIEHALCGCRLQEEIKK